MLQNAPTHYVVRVAGHLDSHWSEWFDGLTITHCDKRNETVLSGPVKDQAALHGFLAKIRDLNLCLIAVEPAEE